MELRTTALLLPGLPCSTRLCFYESSALKNKCLSVDVWQSVSETVRQKENVTTVLLRANTVSMLHPRSQHPLCALCSRAIEFCRNMSKGSCVCVTSFLSIVFPQVPPDIFTVKLVNLRFTAINVVFTVSSTTVKGTVLCFLETCQTQTLHALLLLSSLLSLS